MPREPSCILYCLPAIRERNQGRPSVTEKKCGRESAVRAVQHNVANMVIFLILADVKRTHSRRSTFG